MMNQQAVAELMQELGNRDPALAKRFELMQALLGQQGASRPEGRAEIERRSLVRERIRAMRQKGRELENLCARLADALGACHCFGENASCRDCSGSGCPGALVPDLSAFERFVMPALERLNQTQTTE
jgi:hypothetical protein